MPIHTFQCETCSDQWDVCTDIPRVYRVDEETWIPLFHAPAWCAGCRAVVSAEILLDLNDIDRELSRFATGMPDYAGPWKSDRWFYIARVFGQSGSDAAVQQWEELRDMLDAMRRWRQERTAYPRCLSCGSTAIVEALAFEPNSTSETCGVCGSLLSVTTQDIPLGR